jgi:peptidoglycan/LPS O-acetylase OafA/YrhL
MMNTNYRPEIDGLRAIAVLAVLIYHAFPQYLPGGFIGVDIFFVISGYLITGIIFKELQSGSFGLWSFYQRRIRRIFPALLLVFLICTGLGWLILTPAEYELFGTHMIAGGGFVPNILFWREAGYFDKEAITKPLLHLWSLGVEEQFYLVWPLILAIGWKIFKPKISFVLSLTVILLLASLAWSYYQIAHHPVADFYSPISRFWELAIGGCLAIRSFQLNHTQYQHPVFEFVGTLLLAYGLFGLDSQMAYPGMWALIPCLASVMIIYSSGAPLTPLGYIAQHPVMVFIGLISYPLYLWHWPLLSFARILEGDVISDIYKLALLVLSFGLAWLTYRFIEIPIRASKGSRTALVLLLCMLLAMGFGVVLRKKDGFKHRHANALSADVSTMVVGEFRDQILRPCQLALEISSELDCFADRREPIQYALLGDSKAEALFYGLTTVSSNKGHWLLVDGVHPVPLGSNENNAAIAKVVQVFKAVSQTPSIQVVAIANTMSGLFPINTKTGLILPGSNATEQLSIWSEQIQALESAGKKVVVIIDNPIFPDPTSCIRGGLTPSTLLNRVFTRKANPYCSIAYDQFLEGTQLYRDWLKELQKSHPHLVVFDTSPFLCDVKNNLCSITEGDQFLYSYSNHISDYAAKKIGKALTPLVDNLAKKQ